ncbi:hypothetical protein MP228_002033 [Amoeboaphelidium protococcarum]|nr:hypothetical protein MP228_002033 [Amoeboaphelidium protococcarum]
MDNFDLLSEDSWTSEDERQWQQEKRQMVRTVRQLIPYVSKLIGSIIGGKLMHNFGVFAISRVISSSQYAYNYAYNAFEGFYACMC